MSTLRSRAAIGLGLSLAFASACNSSSSNGKKDGGRDGNRDTPFNTNTNTSTNTATTCTYNGTTYNLGQSFTDNCVRYTCAGTTFTSSGSPCPSDAGPNTTPDTRPGRDGPAPNDTRPAEVAAPVDLGNRDVTPAETGKRDTQAPLDVVSPADTAPPAVDTAPPSPDVPSPVDVPVVCTNAGTDYNPGDSYQPDTCNTCICLGTGDFACTHKTCNLDAGAID